MKVTLEREKSLEIVEVDVAVVNYCKLEFGQSRELGNALCFVELGDVLLHPIEFNVSS